MTGYATRAIFHLVQPRTWMVPDRIALSWFAPRLPGEGIPTMDEPEDFLTALKRTTVHAAKGTPRAYFAPLIEFVQTVYLLGGITLDCYWRKGHAYGEWKLDRTLVARHHWVRKCKRCWHRQRIFNDGKPLH